jgi:[methyl-Co(III) methanol-specific corrinoid protein]:coenzyme M methyltransferase
LFASTKYLTQAYIESADFLQRGRLPVVCEAIRQLKADVGSEVVISGIIPGPFTLLLYLIEPGGLFAEMKREPKAVLDALFHLSSFLARLASSYHLAGADFITIHEMGGSPGFIGPSKFEEFVFPSVQQLISKLPRPTVLSVCGSTNRSMGLLAKTGTDAVSVDQTNDLIVSRATLQDILLFGNLDPVATLWQSDPATIRNAVRQIKEAGADAVWPGCDLALPTPGENIQALIARS